MTRDAVQVPCPDCRFSSPPGSPGLGYWECPGCKRAFFLRRCRACQAVSHVGAQQSWHHRWQCVWCEHRNFGFSRLGDPAAATVADLVADIAGRDLTLAAGDADRQTQPIPIPVFQPVPTPLAQASAAPAAPPAIPPAPPAAPPAPLAARPAAPAAPPASHTIPLATEDAIPPAPGLRRWWRGRRSAALAAAVVLILMAGPAVVLASHASRMPHPGPTGPPRSRTSQQIAVSAGAVRTVDVQGVPGSLTVVGSTGRTVRLTGRLRWTGARPAQAHTTVDRAAHLLWLSYRCAAGSPCTENYRLVVPARTAVILSQPSGQVLLDNLAGPLHITAANINVTATGLRSPSLAAVITSGQLTASFAAPPGQLGITLTSAHAVVRLPASVSYTVSTQVNSGTVQVGVPQAAHSGHLVTARLDSSDLQLQPS